MRIFLIVKNIVANDAISNDVYIQYNFFKKSGYNCYIYSENWSEEYSNLIISKKDFLKLCQKSRNIFIYHYSDCWDFVDNYLEKVKGKKYLKFHNITSPYLFEKNSELFTTSFNSIKKLKNIIEKDYINIYLCDSLYNKHQIIKWGTDSKKCKVIPPLFEFNYRIRSYSRISRKLFRYCPYFLIKYIDSVYLNLKKIFLYKVLLDDKLNILFIGRFVKSKNHIFLLKIIKQIKKSKSNVRLILAGNVNKENLIYFNSIKNYIKKNDLKENVYIIKSAEDEIIKCLYKISHIYLSLSKHEGFCVPLLEAQKYKLPVFVLDKGASRETGGKSLFCYKEINQNKISRDIVTILKNKIDMTTKGLEGLENYKKFENKKIFKRLCKTIGLI